MPGLQFPILQILQHDTPIPKSNVFPFYLQKSSGLSGISTNHDIERCIRASTNLYNKAGQGNWVGGKGTQEGGKNWRYIHFHCLESQQNFEPNTHNTYSQDPKQSNAGSVILVSVSVSPCEPHLVDSELCFPMSLTSLDSAVLHHLLPGYLP